jgi:hypothetical protein
MPDTTTFGYAVVVLSLGVLIAVVRILKLFAVDVIPCQPDAVDYGAVERGSRKRAFN